MADVNKEYVLVTEYFHPDTASTGQLMTDLATGLEDRGLDMTVYTGQPNYHSGENSTQPRRETYEGVNVRRIRAPQVRQTSLLRRLFNWVVFTVWMTFVLLVSRPDRPRETVFVSNPPFLPVAMWVVCTIRDWDYTYVVYDLYPDQPVELGHVRDGGLIDRVWSYFNRCALLGAKHVVVLGPKMRDRVADQAGPAFDVDKTVVVHNWADESFIEPMSKEDNWFSREHDLVEPFTVLYSGNIAEFHDLETLIRAASQFEDDDTQFLIIGEGDNKEKIVRIAEQTGVRGSTVEFLPYQDIEDLPYSLTSGDVSVVTTKDGFEGVCVSSKLYTSMAAGMPVLAIVGDDSDEARIVDAFEAGVHVEQGDIGGVVDAVEAWKEDPEKWAQQGGNARTAFEEYFTKDHSIDRYYRLLTGSSVDPDVTEHG